MNQRTIEQTVSSIEAMNLDPIKFKLMNKEEGYGWTREEADHHEREYRRFLILLAKYPAELIAPSKTVDKFWHGHILDTMKYMDDCDRVFGHYLHHFPYFGMRGEADAANLQDAAKNMRRLYEREFGPADSEAPSFCGRETASFCGATETSFCGRESVSFCGAIENNVAASFCGSENASFCGAEGSQVGAVKHSKLNTRNRPTL